MTLHSSDLIEFDQIIESYTTANGKIINIHYHPNDVTRYSVGVQNYDDTYTLLEDDEYEQAKNALRTDLSLFYIFISEMGGQLSPSFPVRCLLGITRDCWTDTQYYNYTARENEALETLTNNYLVNENLQGSFSRNFFSS